MRPIAVVGMAGLFPRAFDLDDFWQNIINKVNAVRELPTGRWIVEPSTMYHPEPCPDMTVSTRACLIENFRFDPHGINLDTDLLKSLDPLYHIVLHTGKAAVSNLTARSLNRERTGVILAAIALPTDASSNLTRDIFEHRISERLFGPATCKAPTRNQNLASKVTGLPGALLAKGLNFGGGSYTLDAACASSLFAVKLACDELASYRTDAMLAGGVSRPDCLYTQVGFSQLRALSPTGRCAPFDQKADGLVVGEGAGILVLKRLEDAIKCGDRIYGIITGCGLSNDLKGNLLAPDSQGQLRAMRHAYESAGWSPWDIDLIECHGAGTPVGDKTELLSLRKLWGASGWQPGQCAIGSVKSMIGHLLTAAGAAGMIKTLLALNHKILPPSLNFEKASDDSPLHNGPFRVQTTPQQWGNENRPGPRRAAVSAFGFGGINAHLLLEEWDPEAFDFQRAKPVYKINLSNRLQPEEKIEPADSIGLGRAIADQEPPSVAIVGMEAVFGSIQNLTEFQEIILKGESNIGERPKYRWKGCDDYAAKIDTGLKSLPGGFITELPINISEFHIPPNEIMDILPQQLLMLKVAIRAMQNAGLPLRQERPRMGAVIGIDFDMEATNFQLRWNLPHWLQRKGNKKCRLKSGRNKRDDRLVSVPESIGPPLTATRTLGALGSMVASRIARELRLGGPSFVVSGEETSGLKALEIGLRSLQQYESDAFLVGAVDLCGDLRAIISSAKIRSFSQYGKIRPFDRSADGILPGEGAVALVLKRLDQAVSDGDRIYAIVKGIGNASGGGVDTNTPTMDAYANALHRSFQDARVSPSTISYCETHGSGEPTQDDLESEALHHFFNDKNKLCAVGSLKPNIGHTGASAGLAALVKTALCLYQAIIPPLVNFITPANAVWYQKTFHIPASAQYWLRDRQDGPRRAAVAAMTPDGNCATVILEGFENTLAEKTLEKISTERNRPLGFNSFGLFIVEGENHAALIKGLDRLHHHVKKIKKGHIPAEVAACDWYQSHPLQPEKPYAISMIAAELGHFQKWIAEAKHAVLNDTPKRIVGPEGIMYSPSPIGSSGQTAYVYPGSGNHYIGMGRGIGVQWPEILNQMDATTVQLKSQIRPHCYIPHRVCWEPGWEQEAYSLLISDPLNMILGQVVHGEVVTQLVMSFGINPHAVIGYSLGESGGLFAMGAWPDRNKMLHRILDSDLFTLQLAGPCNAARKVWNIPPDEEFDWCVATINRPAKVVRKIIDRWPTLRLLIVNTPDECVIGGRKAEVEATIKKLDCEALFLDGVLTVHCDAVQPVAAAYRELHIFPTTPPKNIRFYSCASGRSYRPTSESAADSILQQALSGFDFTTTIEQAYRDGIRVFLEMGPASSCSRMIKRILGNRPHLAIAACVRGQDDYLTILKFIGTLISERIPANLARLYGSKTMPMRFLDPEKNTPKEHLRIVIGGKMPQPMLPRQNEIIRHARVSAQKIPAENFVPSAAISQLQINGTNPKGPFIELVDQFNKIVETTAEAHNTFLDFSNEIINAYAKVSALQNRLLESKMQIPETGAVGAGENKSPLPSFTRQQCLEFATGAVSNVLGPEFAIVDTYSVRVRLPDEPLMLVDRILSVAGEKRSLSSGRIVTEHDVLPGAWYLNGDSAPVCIAVEAGQADLFLCAYLGIDFAVKGSRAYRLLDASVVFHQELPRPGDVIRYEIEIEKFIKQGDTYLFLFSFEGFIGDSHLISMSNGCAGFFTEAEIRNSGGIIATQEDCGHSEGKIPDDWKELVPVYVESFDEEGVDALRAGNLERCFGKLFSGIELAGSLRLPGDLLKLIDRIQIIDPQGGRYGLGVIRAEADIHPNEWFLTCHFMDDMVMPGTLMYECCAHTLRVFIQRLGWVIDTPGVRYEPVVGVKSVLKCRGPVTPDTKQVIYEVEVKELGYGPEPYVIADAHMYADGDYIVRFTDMSLKMSGITRHQIEAFWQKKRESVVRQRPLDKKDGVFGRDKLNEFAIGKPSLAFGNLYKDFDEGRFIARLPAPPFSFIDRITAVEPQAWVLKPDGWVKAEYDVNPDAWYFRANRSACMPYCILLENALQTCGWMAAYAGSALKSEKALKFRNLEGHAILHQDVFAGAKTLTICTRMTKVSSIGDTILEAFDFQVYQENQIIFEGNTVFGFFTSEALSRQRGIRDIDQNTHHLPAGETQEGLSVVFKDEAPLTPDDPESVKTSCLSMPSRAIRMIDRIEIYLPDGGCQGLGFIRGLKRVDPDEWFFKAHFFQDPVCPGSLGIESFLQLIKFMALDRWPHFANTHRFEHVTDKTHSWIYRGQVVPENEEIVVEATVTAVDETPYPSIMATGFLKVDGLYIYKMDNFGYRLLPRP